MRPADTCYAGRHCRFGAQNCLTLDCLLPYFRAALALDDPQKLTPSVSSNHTSVHQERGCRVCNLHCQHQRPTLGQLKHTRKFSHSLKLIGVH